MHLKGDVMREFINTLKRYLIYIKYNLIIISILTLISAIFNVLMSIFTRNILDEITYIRNFNSVLRTVSMMFVMYIVVSVIKKIKDLLAKGLKQKDICLTLDISKRTYLRDRAFLKEQGLI